MTTKATSVLSGNQITKQEIIACVNLFESISDEEKEPYIQCLISLYEKNKDIIFCVKEGDEVIGTLVLLPIDNAYIQEWSEGQHEAIFEHLAFPEGVFRTYETAGKYSLLFELLAVHHSHTKVTVIKILMEAFAEKILEWARKNIFIEGIYTEAYNREGERMAVFFGMQETKKTGRGKIFKSSATPEKLIAMIPGMLQEYNELYLNYFGKYRF